MAERVTVEELGEYIHWEGAAEDDEERIYLSGPQLAVLLLRKYRIERTEP